MTTEAKPSKSCERCLRGFCCRHNYSERSGDETPVVIMDAYQYTRCSVGLRIRRGFNLAQGKVIS